MMVKLILLLSLLYVIFFCCLIKWQSQCTSLFNMCEVKLGSLNINGAREEAKRAALFNLFKVSVMRKQCR